MKKLLRLGAIVVTLAIMTACLAGCGVTAGTYVFDSASGTIKGESFSITKDDKDSSDPVKAGAYEMFGFMEIELTETKLTTKLAGTGGLGDLLDEMGGMSYEYEVKGGKLVPKDEDMAKEMEEGGQTIKASGKKITMEYEDGDDKFTVIYKLK